jgi:hypothetical protein
MPKHLGSFVKTFLQTKTTTSLDTGFFAATASQTSPKNPYLIEFTDPAGKFRASRLNSGFFNTAPQTTPTPPPKTVTFGHGFSWAPAPQWQSERRCPNDQ